MFLDLLSPLGVLEGGDESQILIVPRRNCYDLMSSYVVYSRLCDHSVTTSSACRLTRSDSFGNLLVVDQRRETLFRLTLTFGQDNVGHRRRFWP